MKFSNMAEEDQDYILLGPEDVEGFDVHCLQPLTSGDIDTICKWLSPTAYASESSEYRKHLSSRLPGTGSWLETSNEYRDWQGDKGALWVKAIPGSGKSVLAASLISHIAEQHDALVLFFFFRQTITANQRPQSLVRDWLSQLLNHSPLIQHSLIRLIKNHRSLDTISFEELWRVLISALRLCHRVYCVADALDEMDLDNEVFLKALVRLGQESPASIKVFVTSRPVPHVERILRHPSVLQIVPLPEVVNADISAYIKHRCTEDCVVSEACRSKLHQSILNRSNGLFLYAKLVLDSLLATTKVSLIGEDGLTGFLDKIPASLAEMYTKMLSDHSTRSGTQQALQIEILRTVTRAERPLRLLELTSLIEFENGLSQTRDTKSVIRSACGPLIEILGDETVSVIHHSFTEFLYRNDYDGMSMHAARNFDPPDHSLSGSGSYDLSSGNGLFPALDYQQTQKTLGVSCLKFLISALSEQRELFSRGCPKEPGSDFYDCEESQKMPNFPESQRRVQELKLSHPFLEYAISNWYKHLEKYDEADSQLSLILDEFMINKKRAFKSWLNFSSTSVPCFPKFCPAKPLHVAAYCGLSGYIDHLLQLGVSIEEKDHSGRTPIFYAAQKGHEKAVATLLAHGARNDEDDNDGYKPLIVAARHNRYKVVQLLVEAGVDPYTPKTREDHGGAFAWHRSTIGDSAVSYACEFGHVETLQSLIPYLKDDGLNKALALATLFGSKSKKCTSALLQAPGIDVNYTLDGRTFLYSAARQHDIAAMRRLLDLGADPRRLSLDNFLGRSAGLRDLSPTYSQPLFGLAYSCTELYNPTSVNASTLTRGFEMLLDAGCDINARSRNGMSILHVLTSLPFGRTASWQYEVLSFLINRGANAAALDNNGSTVLHTALGNPGNVLDLLIQNGANIDGIRTSDGKTPLMLALDHHPQGPAKELISRGAYVNLKDPQGWTPLHYCAYQSNISASESMLDESVVAALLEAGADPNARTSDGQTILHVMRNGFKYEVLQMLLKHGLDLDLRDDHGNTALMKSVTGEVSVESFEKLISAGADIHGVNHEGLNLLHLAIDNRTWREGEKENERLRNLFQKGVDPHKTDNAGNSLLHRLARKHSGYGISMVVDEILSFGVSPFAKNNDGQTALHVALSHNSAHRMNSELELSTVLLDKCGLDINATDNHGVRAIHLAAACSASRVAHLLARGAISSAQTNEGQTALMIACRTRNCNLVGLLADYHLEHDQATAIDMIDKEGRSALHYACIAGRHESVRILLVAGANPDLQDNEHLTPLHTLAEHLQEQKYWTIRSASDDSATQTKSGGLLKGIVSMGARRSLKAKRRATIDQEAVVYVLKTDHRRPTRRCSDPLTVRESLRLLVQNGADLAFLSCDAKLREAYHEKYPVRNPLDIAIEAKFDVMVDELLKAKGNLTKNERTQSDDDDDDDRVDYLNSGGTVSPKVHHTMLNGTIWGQRLILRRKQSQQILHALVESKIETTKLVDELLQDEDEQAVCDLMLLGHDLTTFNSFEMSPLSLLVQWGFSSLLERVASATFKDLNSRQIETSRKAGERLSGVCNSILGLASRRELPNVNTIKVLVETIGVNINEQFSEGQTSQRDSRGIAVMSSMVPGRNTGPFQQSTGTVLHMLARSLRWWHPQALEYLISKGADIEARDTNGDTPLLCASSRDDDDAYTLKTKCKAVRALLLGGANPNVLSSRGLTCLNRACWHTDMVKVLIEFGANPIFGRRPCLNDAIRFSNLDTVTKLLELRVDCNVLPRQPAKTHSDNLSRPKSSASTWDSRVDTCYPLHVAACEGYHAGLKTSIRTQIIKVLLEAGADPHRKYEDGSSILHSIAKDGGLLEPFLERLDIDLEARDAMGRTLLSAACSLPDDLLPHNDHSDITTSLLLSHGASMSTVATAGQNPLHYAIGKSTTRRAAKAFNIFLAHPDVFSILHNGDKKGSKPLHYAFQAKIHGAVDKLLELGADAKESDPADGNTALHYFAERMLDSKPVDSSETSLWQQSEGCPEGSEMRSWTAEHIPAVKHMRDLLARGMNVNTRNHDGDPPLFRFAKRHALRKARGPRYPTHMDLLYVFDEANADFAARNDRGESALHHLAARDYFRGGDSEDQKVVNADMVALFKALVDRGCDPMWEDERQKTCLDLAAVVRNKALLEIFQR